MKKHLHIRHINIRNIMSLCLVCLCVCIALTSVSTVSVSSKSSDTVRQYADAFVSQLAAELKQSNSYLENTILTAKYREMFSTSGMEYVQLVQNLQETYTLMNKLSINNYNYFAYDMRMDKFLEITAVHMQFRDYSRIRKQICRMAEDTPVNGRYELRETDTRERIIITMWVNDGFACGCWIAESDFLAGLNSFNNENIIAFSLYEEGSPDIEPENLYSLNAAGEIKANFSLSVQINSDVVLTYLFILQVIQMILLVIGMVALVMTLNKVKRELLDPMQKLSKVLGKYKKKITSYEMLDSNVSTTLDDTYRILSQMGEDLETMSVRLYEAELEKRQLAINFRTLQIRPHFLVNNLTTIHDMAKLNMTEGIVELTEVLSDYYRYCLRDCMEIVPLRQELHHINNIICVHQFWSGNGVQMSMQVDDDVRECRIPVLLVSTFLENSLKHGNSGTAGLHISLVASRVEEELYIQIRDNGGGFSEEFLERMRSGNYAEKEGMHIGISNAFQRIRLIYGNHAGIQLSNYDQGAQVQIWIPIGEEHETSDC